jgi:hypothetical protein
VVGLGQEIVGRDDDSEVLQLAHQTNRYEGAEANDPFALRDNKADPSLHHVLFSDWCPDELPLLFNAGGWTLS